VKREAASIKVSSGTLIVAKPIVERFRKLLEALNYPLGDRKAWYRVLGLPWFDPP
jgi:hypothetical protein